MLTGLAYDGDGTVQRTEAVPEFNDIIIDPDRQVLAVGSAVPRRGISLDTIYQLAVAVEYLQRAAGII
jgi:hypothetical protein